ncbi:MAG: hypothetical protein KAY11_00415 [Ilumatobacteraceae bacterium]|jgi:hypothetical protein|nr:hypothetical protein [Acidimicrobiaceae bacterium]MBK9972797.1 hypothetical protein [Acidimicrobiaceae bacterium]MBP6486284.1 hypothetical protein [Ilumatobacteraceae bacterium]MBP7887612.1 hypothetical protein [Ilumatobacteraceae bacterium]MBP8207994.1 hypothetical protein [Ilumatobacteraceae bacterium]
MLDHVHYEVQQLLLFAARGNRNDAEQVVRNSLLEAGLVHIRGVIEFLGERKGDRASARDYVPNWTWRPDREFLKMNQLDGRLAHLGLVRAEPGHRWDEWLDAQLPRVLGVFARWLTDLEGCSPALYRQFSAARPGRLQITSEGLIAALR